MARRRFVVVVRRPGTAVAVALCAASCAASCNLVFDIQPGAITGGSGGSTTSSASGGGGTTSSSVTTGGTGGGGASCGTDLGQLSGDGYLIRPTKAAGNDWIDAGTVDSAGNVIAVGSFGAATINLGGGDLVHTPQPDMYDQDAFVAKYSPTNEHVWSHAFGGEMSSVVSAVATGPDDAVWMLGSFVGTLQIGENTLEYDHLPADPPYEDMFVAKLDAGGEVVFAKRFGNSYREHGMALAVDSAGNAFLAGAGFDRMDFGTGMFGVQGSWSSFLLKLSPEGELVWVDSHDYWWPDLAYYPATFREMAVAIDRDDQILFASNFWGQSYFGEAIDTPVGGADAYIVKLDQERQLLWKHFIHGPAGGDGEQTATALATDPCTGDVYVAGSYREGIHVDGGEPTPVIGEPLQDDVFLVKLAADTGVPVWSRTFGDTGYQRIASLAVDPAGDLVLVGTLQDGPGFVGIDFGGEIGILQPLVDPAPNNYRTDLLIAKLSGDGVGKWGHRLGDQWDQYGFSISVDTAGNIAVAGVLTGSLKLPQLAPQSSDDFDGFVAWLRP